MIESQVALARPICARILGNNIASKHLLQRVVRLCVLLQVQDRSLTNFEVCKAFILLREHDLLGQGSTSCNLANYLATHHHWVHVLTWQGLVDFGVRKLLIQGHKLDLCACVVEPAVVGKAVRVCGVHRVHWLLLDADQVVFPLPALTIPI